MTQAQAYLPVQYVGSYSLIFGPAAWHYDQETAAQPHPIVGAHETTEPTGYTAKKIACEGFFHSTDNQALLDMFNFTANDYYRARPVALGIFTQDSAASNPWFTGVGYLTTTHFDYLGGRGHYYFPFRFSWLEAYPLVRIATSTAIANGTTAYAFSMASQPAGYIAGVEFIGSSLDTGGTALSISSVQDNAPATIGTGPALGFSPNLLFGSGGTRNVAATAGKPSVMWPVVDNSSNQSIQRTTAPTGTYTVNLNVGFVTAHLPSAINLVYVAV